MVNPNLISFIARAKRRFEFLKLLEEESQSQVKLMKKTNMYKGHTSRTLKELSDRNLIKCTNPGDRSFRFYKITKKGKDVLKEVKNLLK